MFYIMPRQFSLHFLCMFSFWALDRSTRVHVTNAIRSPANETLVTFWVWDRSTSVHVQCLTQGLKFSPRHIKGSDAN
jgi:hypothetical protein